MIAPIPKQYAELHNPYWLNIIYHGGRSGAKSTTFGETGLDKMRHDRIRFLCCREMLNSIEDSVHSLLERLIEKNKYAGFKVTNRYIMHLKTGSKTIYSGLNKTSRSIKSMDGINLAWVEEAQDVTQESLTFFLPTIREEGCQRWFSMNRFKEDDPVWTKLCENPSKRTFVMQVNLDDLHPYFQNKTALEDQEQDKLSDYQHYLHVWKGQPVGQKPNSIMSSMEVQEAMNRNIEPLEGETEQVGADIAREGDDKIVFCKKKGNKIYPLKKYTKLKTFETEANLKAFTNSKKTNINIDMGAMGPGVYDHLDVDGYTVTPINFGGSLNLNNPDLYDDCASEMWFTLAGMIDKIDLPNDTTLKRQLTSRLYGYKKKTIKDDKNKRKDVTVRKIESKEDYKKREKKSCDEADAVVMAFYNQKPKPKAQIWFA